MWSFHIVAIDAQYHHNSSHTPSHHIAKVLNY